MEAQNQYAIFVLLFTQGRLPALSQVLGEIHFGGGRQAVVPERTAWPPWPGPTSGRTEGALRGQGALDGVVRSVPVREPAGRAWATPLPPRRGPPQRPSSRLGDPLSEATRAAAPAHADVHAGGTTGGRPADHAGTNHSNTRLFRASVDTEI